MVMNHYLLRNDYILCRDRWTYNDEDLVYDAGRILALALQIAIKETDLRQCVMFIESPNPCVCWD